MKQILSLASPLDLVPVLLVSLLALGSGLGLLSASAWLIASAALEPPLYTLTLGITSVRAFGIGRAGFRYFERFLSHRIAFSGLTHIRVSLYDRAARALPLRSGAIRQGEYLHDLLTGADALRDFFVRAFLPPITVGLATTILTALLYRLIGAPALLFLLLFAIRLITPLVGKAAQEEHRRQSEAVYRSLLLDTAEGRTELIAAGRGAETRLAPRARGLLEADTELATRHATQDAWGTLLDRLFLVTLLALLAPQVANGTITGVTLAVFFLATQSLLIEYGLLPEAVRQAQKSIAAARHLLPKEKDGNGKDTEDATPQNAETARTPSNTVLASDSLLLTADSLSFAYRPGAPVLSSLSFQIHQGEHTAILGASGAGKTTLAELLLGVWPPDSGTITYHTAAPRPIAGLPQGSVLFAKSIRENFRIYRPEASEEAIRSALATAQLPHVVNAMKDGIDTSLGENAIFLSGGERNRLLTAIALAGSEPLLLLDEPTAGLDPKTAARLLDALSEHTEKTGKTLLVITHEEEYLPRFKKVIRLS